MKKLSKNILIVVLARKNSKRIKNKNIRKINGKSLVYITLEFAKNLGYLIFWSAQIAIK